MSTFDTHGSINRKLQIQHKAEEKDVLCCHFKMFLTPVFLVFDSRRGGEVMAGRRRTSFSGVIITTLLVVMLLPGEYKVGIGRDHSSHNQGHVYKYIVTAIQVVTMFE